VKFFAAEYVVLSAGRRVVCRCRTELDSSDSAFDTRSGSEQVPDVTSQMIDLQQQLLYDLA